MDVKTASRLAGVLVGLALLTSFAGLASYYLPATEKVRLTGTEIKRRDAKDGSLLHDVRYIQATRLDGSSLVFRNEDTRWSFPFYFKFNSADLAGEAQSIAKSQPEAVVLVTYYGVRSQVLDLYPNAVAFHVVDANYVHVPIFNIVFVLLTLVLAVVTWIAAKRVVLRLSTAVGARVQAARARFNREK